MRQDVLLSLYLYPEGIRQPMAKISRVSIQADRLVLIYTSVKALKQFFICTFEKCNNEMSKSPWKV